MALRIQHITFDVRDATATSTFWAAALGLEVLTDPNPQFALVGSDGVAQMMFNQVPESKDIKNRVHIDVAASDPVEEEIARLLELGATRIEDKDLYNWQWTIMADPEGNEFCISPDAH